MVPKVIMSILSLLLCVIIAMMALAKNLDVMLRFVIPCLLFCCTLLLMVAYRLHLNDQKRQKSRSKGRCDSAPPVSVVLSGLPENFVVIQGFDAVELGIDYIVIGPTGIFVIDTVDLRGGVEVRNQMLCLNNTRSMSGYLAGVREKTEKLRLIFKTFGGTKRVFKPVLCFTQAYVNLKARGDIDGVLVTSLKSINAFLVDAPQVLDSFDVYRSQTFLCKELEDYIPHIINHMDFSSAT